MVVEVESGGGVTNLAKYWPHLAAGRPPKRFVLAHLFLVSSTGGYISHRRLWEFLVARMREDRAARGVLWGRDWQAALFTYEEDEEPDDATRFIREAMMGELPSSWSDVTWESGKGVVDVKAMRSKTYREDYSSCPSFRLATTKTYDGFAEQVDSE